jgi:hypothetical protein
LKWDRAANISGKRNPAPEFRTRMMKFCEYVADRNPTSALDPDGLLDDAGWVENAVLAESFSATSVKTVAVGILLKLSQLRQQILHDRTAGSGERALSNMIFWMGIDAWGRHRHEERFRIGESGEGFDSAVEALQAGAAPKGPHRPHEAAVRRLLAVGRDSLRRASTSSTSSASAEEWSRGVHPTLVRASSTRNQCARKGRITKAAKIRMPRMAQTRSAPCASSGSPVSM